LFVSFLYFCFLSNFTLFFFLYAYLFLFFVSFLFLFQKLNTKERRLTEREREFFCSFLLLHLREWDRGDLPVQGCWNSSLPRGRRDKREGRFGSVSAELWLAGLYCWFGRETRESFCWERNLTVKGGRRREVA
jgi:hypothetical protein